MGGGGGYWNCGACLCLLSIYVKLLLDFYQTLQYHHLTIEKYNCMEKSLSRAMTHTSLSKVGKYSSQYRLANVATLFGTRLETEHIYFILGDGVKQAKVFPSMQYFIEKISLSSLADVAALFETKPETEFFTPREMEEFNK